MTKTLHQVIIETVKASPVPLSAAEITAIIAKKELWHRSTDGMTPLANQISARVNKYPHLFKRENGVIKLVDEPVVKTEPEEEVRLCKIVWNSGGWIQPITRKWSRHLQGKPDIPFEKRYGFVHEDWLFNPAFIIGGYYYGMINAFNSLAADVNKVDTVHLFTINPYTKERLYVGKLYNAEKVDESDLSKKVLSIVRKNNPNMISDLKQVGADHTFLEKRPFMPNVRFKVVDKQLFDQPLLIESDQFNESYKRTLPMKITPELLGLLESVVEEPSFSFCPSAPYGRRAGYRRREVTSDTTVEKVHNAMEVALYEYLIRKGIQQDAIACDRTSFGGNLADVVVKKGRDIYDIYEIKTTTDIRRGLREAAGQLIDYAFWEKNIRIGHLYVVLPFAELSASMRQYVLRVCKALSLPLDVVLYDKDRGLFITVR